MSDRVWYTTREAVKDALSVKETARNNNAVDRAIRTASDMVEGQLHRRFYPELTTRYFDWPNRLSTRTWLIWLDENEMISVTSLVSGGVTISASDFNLEPKGYGPPFDSLELDISTSAAFTTGATFQNSIAITGLFGYTNNEETNGALNEALDTTETLVDVTDSSRIGVGSLIRVDSERMQVVGRSMMDTTQNIVGSLTASDSDVTVAVADGTAFFVGEVILLDSERMLIVDIAGNNLTVDRAYDGSVLATHTTSDVYAPRRLEVVRGVLGTTAASHNTSTAISRHLVPPLVEELCIAEALNLFLQRTTGWSREIGSGDNARESSGRGLAQIRRDAWISHGRKARTRAV